MTVIPLRDFAARKPAVRHVRLPAWLRDWLRIHRTSLAVITPLLVMIGVAHAWNMYGWPGRLNDDEGTYIAQAWAVMHENTLAHYTYWYDHPPLGWMTIALYAWLTDGFDNRETVLMLGREAMLFTNLVSCALLYMLARRLGLHRAFAAGAVVAFAFSPLAMQFHRMVFLDNMAIAWVLAAAVLAASPRRSLAAVTGSAICMTGAVLTKETAALLVILPAGILVQRLDKRMRPWALSLWVATGLLTVAMYPLYALIKNELFEGPGHVSLEWALWWQLFGRGGSGSLLDPTSGTFQLARSWTDMDPWLLVAGIVLIPAGLYMRRLRPVAATLLVSVLMLMREGYVPHPYVIALLPTAALLIGGVADGWWSARRSKAADPVRGSRAAAIARMTGRALVATSLILFAAMAAPNWGQKLTHATTVDLSGPSLQATEWIAANLAKDDVIIVDDYVWTDLATRGFHNQIWFYKADLDPAVQEELLPNGYASVDYVVLGNLAPNTLDELPTVATAMERSRVVATFGDGELVIRKVIKPRPG